jgi:hypothetical protein
MNFNFVLFQLSKTNTQTHSYIKIKKGETIPVTGREGP